MSSDFVEMVEKVEDNLMDVDLIGFELLPVQDDASLECFSGHEADKKIMPFRYRIDGQSWWMRGAFTNGDPVWEENDPEAFAKMMGESAS